MISQLEEPENKKYLYYERNTPNPRLQPTWPRLKERTLETVFGFPAKMVTTWRMWPSR
jgi:hypothetical protein